MSKKYIFGILTWLLSKKFLLICLIFLMAIYGKTGFCVDSPDAKVWLAQKLSHDFGSVITLKLDFNERFDDDVSRWEEFYIDTGIDCKVSDWFVLAPRYRHVKARFNNPDEATENRIHINLIFKAKLEKLSMSLRSRMEHRLFKDDIVKHRFTEMLKMSYPVGLKVNDKDIQAYFSNELYYDLDKKKANNNEIHLGLEMWPYKGSSFQLYYGHEIKKKDGKWNFHTNILGIEVGYKI